MNETTPALADYDIILINTSAGKDSQAMMDVVVKMARAAGVADRVVAVHCDLKRAEWAGTRELAETQAARYNVPLHIVTRPQGDLLDQIEQRKMFPSSTARYCTSDQKRGQVYSLLTKLVRESGVTGRPVRILNCLGIRAEESSARSKKTPFQADKQASNGKRAVDTWFPIFTWTVAQVWDCIKASGVPHHRAYDLGMPRLSCVFCVLASKDALLLAGEHNPALLEQYVALENRIGHTLQHKYSAAQLQADLAAGVRANPLKVANWCM
jgi:3'-phosphoadenosine 5'-phosphosulfate sulfotransferase (PAPS reductase)/FAD synthetase